jgi:hypothetical protein
MADGRRSYFALAVRNFDQKLASQPNAAAAREQLINGIVCMQLQLPVRSFSVQVLLNRQLCFMSDRPFGSAGVHSPRGLAFIHPITPMARTAAIDYYLSAPVYVQALQSAYREVFATPTLDASARGFILQRYIIQQFRAAASFALLGRQYDADHALSAPRQFCSARLQLRVVEWNGNGVPPFTLSRLEDLLLVPLTSNYPGVDFLIWKADTETLFLFQVTVRSVAQHSDFWQNRQQLQDEWAAMLGVKTFERVWITPDVNAGVPEAARSNAGQWACSLALLKSTNSELFPLLQELAACFATGR